MKVVIAGASGFIGRALADALRGRGDEVVRLVRRPPQAADEVEWHPERSQLDPRALDGADAAVNLAGESIGNRRWSAAQKDRIRRSRIDATSLLAGAILRHDRPPRVFVNASAIGVYGDRGDAEVDESAAAGAGFLADVVRQWEEAATPASAVTRVALARTGIVLDRQGGTLPRMMLPFRFGVGGRLGSGRQWMSWITLHDHVRAMCWLLDRDVSGPVNLTAPNPITNAQFTRTLGRALHRPTLLPVPRLTLHLLLGREFADELLFSSQRVLPRQLTDSGFAFDHPTIEPALAAALTG